MNPIKGMVKMNATRRLRTDPRKEKTRLHLIEVAERLFGEQGVQGVSLRQIASAAGSANVSVVSYHFTNKQGLLRAIFEQRQAVLEIARGHLLADVRRESKDADTSALVRALYEPLIQLRDSRGRRSYAAFVAGLLRLNQFGIRLDQAPSLAPVSEEIAVLLRSSLLVSAAVALRRQRMATLFVCDAIVLVDSARTVFPSDEDDRFMTDDILNMAAAALRVRPPDELGPPGGLG